MDARLQSYVLFEIAGTIYGLASESVQHIAMFEHVTLVPNANQAIDGVVYSRGQIIPALNLRVRFGFPRLENTVRTRIVFASVHGRTVGLIVDTAREFHNFPAESIRPIEETLTGVNGRYLKAVSKADDRLILIIDLEAVLNVDDVQIPPRSNEPVVQNATS
jgi:purine-binding chemotaxis protein CheW